MILKLNEKPTKAVGFFSAANQIRTDTPVVWALPPQGSASTNFATAAFEAFFVVQKNNF